MRVECGGYSHTATDGTHISVDRRLRIEQVDLLVGILRANDRCPSCTAAVELSEGGCTIEWPAGMPGYRSTYCTHDLVRA